MVKGNARLKFVLAIGLLIWLALVARLFYLQVLSHDDLAFAAASQYEITVEGLDIRGAILDRNMERLTGQSEQYYYILPKDKVDHRAEALIQAIKAKKVSAQNGSYVAYRSEMFDETVNERLKDEYRAYVFACPSRYEDSQLACHLIGYLNEDEKRGVSGIELMCEDRLKADNSKLTLWADSRGKILLGLEPKKKTESILEDDSVVTTIEKNLQRLCEAALEENGISGSVVVAQAWDGEILAWASSPTFNPNDVESHLTGGGDCLINKAVQGCYAPGSVFKVITAAAALKNNVCSPLSTFECKGKITVEGVELGCNSGPEEGHGRVNMYEAMAQSCNCYFAALGEETGGEAILETAEKFGLGKRVIDFPEEREGTIMTGAQFSSQDISNLSIGQGRTLTTPMQIANMMNIIANGGIRVPLTIFAGSLGEQEEIIIPKLSEDNRVISEETAEEIEKMLAMVMTEGTAGGQRWPCPVYGKSGTAEATWGEKEVNHCWFTGYCQVDGKRYTITVLAEEGVSGSATALPVYSKIVNYISDK